jgi:RNA 3'-terminal phosphate cyclase-like protein
LPEDIGREAALQLLEEVWKGGVIDRSHQPLVLMLMVLGPEDVCKVPPPPPPLPFFSASLLSPPPKVRFGSELTDASVECLRLLREAFGVVFKIKEETEEGSSSLLLSCLGTGFMNMSRKAT